MLLAALLSVSVACPDQRLKPRALVLPPLIADVNPTPAVTDNAASTHGNQPSVPERVVENFVIPVNTVSTFLSALQTNDRAKLERTLAPKSELRRDLGKLEAEPWRWSELRCRVWLYTGVGPTVRNNSELCHVVLEPPSKTSYHAKFALVKFGENWLVDRLEVVYSAEEFVASELMDKKVVREVVAPQLAEATGAAATSSTKGFVNGLLTQRRDVEKFVPVRELWALSLPKSERAGFNDERFAARRAEMLERLATFLGWAEGAEFRGSYEERRYRLSDAETDSAAAEIRLCFSGGQVQGMRNWSFRILARRISDKWWLTAVDSKDPEAFDPKRVE